MKTAVSTKKIERLNDREVTQVSGGLNMTGYRTSNNVGDQRDICADHGQYASF